MPEVIPNCGRFSQFGIGLIHHHLFLYNSEIVKNKYSLIDSLEILMFDTLFFIKLS